MCVCWCSYICGDIIRFSPYEDVYVKWGPPDSVCLWCPGGQRLPAVVFSVISCFLFGRPVMQLRQTHTSCPCRIHFLLRPLPVVSRTDECVMFSPVGVRIQQKHQTTFVWFLHMNTICCLRFLLVNETWTSLLPEPKRTNSNVQMLNFVSQTSNHTVQHVYRTP